MSQLDQTFSGTKDVADALRFDEAALDAWMQDHVDGYAGPLTVSQFKGGQSNRHTGSAHRPLPTCSGESRRAISCRPPTPWTGNSA